MASYHSGRLSSMDASFLYLERDSAPMHIGALCILDGPLDFERYRERIEAKLPRLRRFRERLVPAPLNLGHPTWEPDDEFDIERHLLRHRLEDGTMDELRASVNELVAIGLDRERPLWELHVIEGLEDDRTAVVSKVHHAMVDGVGGNAILTTLFDLEPDAPMPEPVEEEFGATETMDRGQRMLDALFDSARDSLEAWAEHARRISRMGRSFDGSQLQSTLTAMAEGMPDAMLPPRRLPFNRRCNGERALAWTSVSFAEARGIRGALGGTVNDVMLAVLGGAVRRYCELHGESTEGRSMRVMVPVNVRGSDQSGDLGNQVSVMPVQVPLQFEDHGDRLRAIRASTRTLKEGRVAEGVSLLTNLSGTVPPPLQAAFGSFANPPFPVFNIVCTNVPGPQIPLYALDRRLLEYYPHVPVGHQMGVCCAIFSYDQRLFVGLNSDVGACPDVDRLRDFWDECFLEMRELAGVPAVDRVAIREPLDVESAGRSGNGSGSANGAERGRGTSKKKAAGRRKTASRKKKATARKKKATGTRASKTKPAGRSTASSRKASRKKKT